MSASVECSLENGRVRSHRGAEFYRRRHLSLRPRKLFGAAVLGTLLTTASIAPACSTVPVTGRSAFNIASVDQDKQLGAEAYAEVLKTAKLKDNGPEFQMVKRVVDRLVKVADDPGFQWEVHVIDDPKTVNAWCMPGGKIAVYTGILPLTQDETGLAVVLGHEMGHAVARHGTERMSQEQVLGGVLSVVGTKYQNLAQYQSAIGMVVNYGVLLPFGRDQESEADHIGLIYMARAGFDPRKAVEFWERMAKNSGGGAPPELLSTHPSDEHRIADIKHLMKDALKEYERAGGTP